MSNFRPDPGGRRWSLVRFAGSVALRGGRGAADRCHWRVWGALAVFWPHWVCPRSRRVLCPSTLLRLPAASVERAPSCVRFQFSGIPQKRSLGWACVLCLPRSSSSGSQELDGRSLPGCSASYPFLGPSLSFPRGGRVRLVSVLGSWTLAVTLLEHVNHTESPEVFG